MPITRGNQWWDIFGNTQNIYNLTNGACMSNKTTKVNLLKKFLSQLHAITCNMAHCGYTVQTNYHCAVNNIVSKLNKNIQLRKYTNTKHKDLQLPITKVTELYHDREI